MEVSLHYHGLHLHPSCEFVCSLVNLLHPTKVLIMVFYDIVWEVIWFIYDSVIQV